MAFTVLEQLIEYLIFIFKSRDRTVTRLSTPAVGACNQHHGARAVAALECCIRRESVPGKATTNLPRPCTAHKNTSSDENAASGLIASSPHGIHGVFASDSLHV